MLCSWVPSGIDGQRQGVAHAGLRGRAGDHRVPDLQAVGHQDVALLAVRVVQQPDARRPVGVVLDRGQLRGHVPLVAPEVDPPVVALLAAATMANGHAALMVAAAPPLLRLEQRLVGGVGGDLLEGRAGHEPPTGRGRLVTSQRHRLHPLEEFDLVAGRDRHDGLLPGRGEALDAAALAVAALLLGLRGQDVDVHDRDLEELLDGVLDHQLVGVVMDRERVLATLRLIHRLLADHRSQHDLRSQERHAYTSDIVEIEGWVMSSTSASRTSTTLSESARIDGHAGHVARGELQALVLAGLDHEDLAARPGARPGSRPARGS